MRFYKYLIVRTNYLHDQLGAFSLPSSRLPTDDNALVLPECRHPGVGRRANGEEMRREGAEDLVLVLGHRLQPVDVEHPVGVDSHQDRPGVRVDEVGVIPQPEISEVITIIIVIIIIIMEIT